MTMPEIDKTSTSHEWLAFYKPDDDGHVHWAPRSAVLQAQRNTHIGSDPTASFFGLSVDESECIEMIRAMNDAAARQAVRRAHSGRAS